MVRLGTCIGCGQGFWDESAHGGRVPFRCDRCQEFHYRKLARDRKRKQRQKTANSIRSSEAVSLGGAARSDAIRDLTTTEIAILDDLLSNKHTPQLVAIRRKIRGSLGNHR